MSSRLPMDTSPTCHTDINNVRIIQRKNFPKFFSLLTKVFFPCVLISPKKLEWSLVKVYCCGMSLIK